MASSSSTEVLASTGLQNCPTEVFAVVSASISGYDLARLLFCGNGALIRLIRSGATHLDCSLTSYGRNRWPNLVSELTHLRTLIIGHRYENPDFRGPFLPGAIFTAPLTHLRSLKLYFANAFLSLFLPLSQLDLTVFQDPEPIDFASLMPNLMTLHALNAYSTQSHRFKCTKLFKALGALSLTELFLEPFSVSTSDLPFLPKTLEKLKLKPFEMNDDLEELTEWPPGLQWLTLKQLVKPLLYTENLPKSLRSLSLHAHQGNAKPIMEKLPRRLRRLKLLSRVFNFGEEEYALLPHKLEYLKVHVQLVVLPTPSTLPRTLIDFNIRGGWTTGATLPDTDFPPNLKTFLCSKGVDDASLKELPNSIERYTMVSSYQVQPNIRPVFPNLNHINILDTTVESLTMLNGAALRTLELSAYGPSPVALMSNTIITKAHFDAIDAHAPNLRRLVIHNVMYSVDMRDFKVPLEYFEAANCYDLGDFLNPNAAPAPNSVKRSKKEVSTPPGEVHLWSRNLHSLMIWGNAAHQIRHHKAFANRLPRTLKVFRLFHKNDPIPICFDGSELMKHLPPQLEEFAAFFSPMPSPATLSALPKTLHTLHFGGRHFNGNKSLGLTNAHLKALPYSITDLLLPPSTSYPSEEFLDEWCKDRPELVQLRIFYDINSDRIPLFLFTEKSAPATSLATAMSGTITDRPIPREISSSANPAKEKKGSWLSRLLRKG